MTEAMRLVDSTPLAVGLLTLEENEAGLFDCKLDGKIINTESTLEEGRKWNQGFSRFESICDKFMDWNYIIKRVDRKAKQR